MFTVGEKVIVVYDMEDVNSLKEEIITGRVDEDYFEIASNKKAMIPGMYIYPLEYKQELEDILRERMKAKKIYDNTMGLFYKLRNKITLARSIR